MSQTAAPATKSHPPTSPNTAFAAQNECHRTVAPLLNTCTFGRWTQGKPHQIAYGRMSRQFWGNKKNWLVWDSSKLLNWLIWDNSVDLPGTTDLSYLRQLCKLILGNGRFVTGLLSRSYWSVFKKLLVTLSVPLRYFSCDRFNDWMLLVFVLPLFVFCFSLPRSYF